MEKKWDKDQWDKHWELVKRGKLSHLFHKPQRKLNDFLEEHPEVSDIAIYACRKIGKTFFLCGYGISYCLKNPGVVVRHILPTLKNAKDVVVPVMGEYMPFLPDDSRPEYYASTQTYKFKNGSQYILGGAHSDSIESARGPRCDLFLFDEVCFFDTKSYEYAMDSVFQPQQTLVEHPRRIYASTPPITPDHPFIIKTLPSVQADGAFFKFTAYDNPLLTPDRLEEIKQKLGENSNAWRREYLAELVVDDSWRVVPEFDQAKHVVPQAQKTDFFGNDTKFRGYLSSDYGVGEQDFTGLLTGFFDHNRQKLVITGERLLKSPPISDFIAEWEKIQLDHLKDTVDNHKTLDAFEQLRFSLRHDYNLEFSNPRKGKVQETVAFLRNCFENDRVEILDSCPLLIQQLENGIWKENKKDFERSDTLGHLDLLICLVYMVRAVDWDYRPGVNRINLRLGLAKTQGNQNDRKTKLRGLR